jgi:hypothetical protein
MMYWRPWRTVASVNSRVNALTAAAGHTGCRRCPVVLLEVVCWWACSGVSTVLLCAALRGMAQPGPPSLVGPSCNAAQAGGQCQDSAAAPGSPDAAIPSLAETSESSSAACLYVVCSSRQCKERSHDRKERSQASRPAEPGCLACGSPKSPMTKPRAVFYAHAAPFHRGRGGLSGRLRFCSRPAVP